jgi:hypothetical protein
MLQRAVVLLRCAVALLYSNHVISFHLQHLLQHDANAACCTVRAALLLRGAAASCDGGLAVYCKVS